MNTEDQQPQTEEITRAHIKERPEFRSGVWFNNRSEVIDHDDVEAYAKEFPARPLYLVARDGNTDYLHQKDKNRKELKLDNPKNLKKVEEIGFLRATCMAMAVAILLSWRNVYSHEDNEDGTPKQLEPTLENRRKVLLENPEIRESVQEFAADFKAFDDYLRAKSAGKSQAGSTGGRPTGPTSVATS